MKITIVDRTGEPQEVLLKNFMGDELELAHQDYEKRKKEMIGKLYTIWRNTEIPALYRNWIRQAARFVNEREI